MNIEISIDVPVSSHVKKYLENSRYFKTQFKLTSTDHVGSYLMHLLKPVPKKYHPLKQNKNSVKFTGVYWSVNLAGYSDRGKWYIDARGINCFNNFVDDIIKTELYIYVDANRYVPGNKVTNLINDFIDKYNFTTEELTFEGLKKAYFRYRKSLEFIDNKQIKIFSENLSLKNTKQNS